MKTRKQKTKIILIYNNKIIKMMKYWKKLKITKIINEIIIIINLKMKNMQNLINKSKSDIKVMINKNKLKIKKIKFIFQRKLIQINSLKNKIQI